MLNQSGFLFILTIFLNISQICCKFIFLDEIDSDNTVAQLSTSSLSFSSSSSAKDAKKPRKKFFCIIVVLTRCCIHFDRWRWQSNRSLFGCFMGVNGDDWSSSIDSWFLSRFFLSEIAIVRAPVVVVVVVVLVTDSHVSRSEVYNFQPRRFRSVKLRKS